MEPVEAAFDEPSIGGGLFSRPGLEGSPGTELSDGGGPHCCDGFIFDVPWGGWYAGGGA